MKKIFILTSVLIISFSICYGQKSDDVNKKIKVGFSGILPTGVWPATALSTMAPGSSLKDLGHPVTSYGFGVIFLKNFTSHISMYLDVNIYDFNIFLAHAGDDPQSVWTTAQGALHWDEPDAPQILYLSNLPTDVIFDMQTLGIRAGAKYSFNVKNIRPYISLGVGYYNWNVNYYSADKTKTYGEDTGNEPALTYQAGIDFPVLGDMIFSVFADLASPVADYHIEGLFYPQWDIDYSSPAMGTTRFGVSLAF